MVLLLWSLRVLSRRCLLIKPPKQQQQKGGQQKKKPQAKPAGSGGKAKKKVGLRFLWLISNYLFHHEGEVNATFV